MKTTAFSPPMLTVGRPILLTTDGTHLILSDGTATLRFLDPESMAVERQLTVREEDIPVVRLNELEYIEGEIWANIWYADRIARVSPATGEVLGWIDLSALYPRSEHRDDDVLNGIAVEQGGSLRFVPVAAPSARELQRLVQTVAERIGRSLERSGLITRDVENAYLAFDPSEEPPTQRNGLR